jgi:hypothetical protein
MSSCVLLRKTQPPIRILCVPCEGQHHAEPTRQTGTSDYDMSLPQNAEAATFAWDELAQRLERFIATWDAGSEPTLADFLPPDPPTLRRLVLVELVKVDLEQRTTRGKKKPLESYTTDFPELLENGEPPCDLIYEEYHIRRTAGEKISARE